MNKDHDNYLLKHIVGDEKEKDSLGYKLGQGLAIILATCGGAILIALTVKLILWIL